MKSASSFASRLKAGAFLAACHLAVLAQTANLPAAPPPSPSAPQVLTPAWLNQLSDEMRTNSPALQAARARWEAARLNARSVRAWEDPELFIGGMGARRDMRAEDGDLIYGVEQMLPIFRKPYFQKRAALAEAATAEARESLAFQLLRLELARAAFRLAIADTTVAIGGQDLIWLETLAQTTSERYAAGTSSQVELLTLQNDRDRKRQSQITETNRRDHERVVLNRLLRRPLDAPWPVLQLPPLADAVPYHPRLVALAVKNEPQIKVMEREVEEASANLQMTRRSRWPDVAVELEGRNYSGNGDFREGMVLFRFSVPVVNRSKYRRDIERDRTKLTAAALDRDAYALEVEEEIHGLTIALDAARREALLYREEIIPRSEQTLASAEAAWLAGREPLRVLLEARRMLIDARLMEARAVAEQYLAMSELVLCCGLADLEALQMFNRLPASLPGQPANTPANK